MTASPRRSLAITATLCAAATAALAETRVYQNGTTMADGKLYWGAQDVELFQSTPTTNFANSSTLSIDTQVTAGNANTQVQTLLKFNNLFGTLSNQIPIGSTINSVSLTFNTSNISTNSTSFYRMPTAWHEQNTWATHGPLSGGIADATVTAGATGFTTVSGAGLISSVQAWANGTAANEGWAMIANGSDGWDVASSETGTVANRPKLTIDYTPPANPAPINRPKNVILFVGDGMGTEAVKAAKLKLYGNTTTPLAFEFANKGLMTHNNGSDAETDSAASATALATGVKVANGNISQNTDGTPIKSVLEIMQEKGKRTGLITTGTAITDATPAAFGAHEASRNNGTSIAGDYVNSSKPNVLFGQPGSMPTNPAGYLTITNQTQLQNLDTNQPYVSGQFTGVSSTTGPSLSLMATQALEVLSNDPDGFFLLVENEDTDSGGHSNNITQVINGVQSLSNAVGDTVTWLTANGMLEDTLIIVLADHETGGLTVVNGNGIGLDPTVTWTTTGHTQTPIGVWAMGPSADLIHNTIDSTDVFRILSTAPEPASLSWVAIGTAGLLRRRRNVTCAAI